MKRTTNKNLSREEISEREPFYDNIAHVLQNTEKIEPTFSKLNASTAH